MQKEKAPFFWLRQAPITIVGVLILGIIGSTLYDLLVKPGLTSFGRFVLNVVTLGSTTLKNAAYSSAALDPTPISALVLLQAALFLVTLPATRLLARSLANRDTDELEKKLNDAPKGEKKQKLTVELSRLKRKLKIMTLAFWTIFLPTYLALLVAFSVHNQSVIVWRAFNANLAILGPQITVDERLTLHSMFASMETGNDYKVIQARMKKLAESKGMKLKSIETW
jgi:hypothetical protein